MYDGFISLHTMLQKNQAGQGGMSPRWIAREYKRKMCIQIYGMKMALLVIISIYQLIKPWVVSVEGS